MSTIRSFILDDQTDDVVALLKSFVEDKRKEATAGTTSESGSVNEIGIVVDNAGYELVSDLVLGHCLLATGNAKGFCAYITVHTYTCYSLSGAADVVTFHTKGHPTFVSDATTKDVLETIAVLRNSPMKSTANLGE